MKKLTSQTAVTQNLPFGEVGGADFNTYLIKNEYSHSTIHQIERNVLEFMNYCKNADIEKENVNFQTVLAFIEILQKRGVKPQTVNIRLSSIKKYYEYLKQYGYLKINPIDRIKQKGTPQTIITNALTNEQLQAIYSRYAQEKTYREKKLKLIHQRNTVIVGLLIYQGLHAGELRAMQLQDIDVNTATVFIRAGKQSNERYIKLQANQMLHIYKYINEALPYLKKVSKGSSSPPSGELEGAFTGNLNNIIFYIINELKGYFPQIQNAGHIRASVILNWMKQYDKRQTQYLIGHRYISSTEKYQQQDLQSLTDMMKSFHPFG
jgi:integrase/recombinase XerD